MAAAWLVPSPVQTAAVEGVEAFPLSSLDGLWDLCIKRKGEDTCRSTGGFATDCETCIWLLRSQKRRQVLAMNQRR